MATTFHVTTSPKAILSATAVSAALDRPVLALMTLLAHGGETEKGVVGRLSDELPAGPVEPWRYVQPARPDTAHVRALRVIDALGETVAALVIIAGGVIATGLATLL